MNQPKSFTKSFETAVAPAQKVFLNTVQRFFPLGFKKDFMQLLLTTLPLIVANISQIFITSSSLLFCGHLGTEEFDGASLALSVINMSAMVCAYGFTSACDTLFPQLVGAKNHKKLGIVLQKALVIGVISSIFSIILLLNARNMLLAVTDETKVVLLADEYILIFLPSTVFFTMAQIFGKLLQAQNYVNPITIINLIAITINCVLHAIFIYGFKWGLWSAAFSINITTFSLMAMTMGYIYMKKLHLQSWDGWSYECLTEWKIYLKLAIPAVVTLLIEWSNFEIGTFIAVSISKCQLALISISQNYILIFFEFSYSIGVAANIIVGQSLGANKPKEAKNATLVSMVLNGMSVLTSIIFLLSFSYYLPYVFIQDDSVIVYARDVVKALAFVHLFDGTQGANMGILRAVGANLYASVIMFIGFYLIGTPIGLSLLIKTDLKIYGFLIGIICGEIVLVFLQFFYIFRINWTVAAHEAHEFAKVEEEEKVKVEEKVEYQPDTKMTMSNPNFISTTDESDGHSKILKIDMTHEYRMSASRIKELFLKRSIILAIFLAFLLVSAVCHNLVKVGNDISVNNSTDTIDDCVEMKKLFG